jgi:hypothetical protein
VAGAAILWKQYQQWEAVIEERFPLLAALYKRRLLGGTGAYPQLVHDWAMLVSYNGKRNYAMLEEGLDFPARSVVKDDCRRERERLAREALFSNDPSAENISRFVERTLKLMAPESGEHLVPDADHGVTADMCAQFTLSCDAVKAAEVVGFDAKTGVVTGLTYQYTLSAEELALFTHDRAAFAEWVQERKTAKEVASDVHIVPERSAVHDPGGTNRCATRQGTFLSRQTILKASPGPNWTFF